MEQKPEVRTERAPAGAAEPARSAPRYVPDIDILETADEIRILADVPGADADGIDVRCENGVLSILAKVRARHPDRSSLIFEEYGTGDFVRSFELGEPIDSGRIAAEVSDGVLMLRLPKSEAAKPRKIAIQKK